MRQNPRCNTFKCLSSKCQNVLTEFETFCKICGSSALSAEPARDIALVHNSHTALATAALDAHSCSACCKSGQSLPVMVATGCTHAAASVSVPTRPCPAACCEAAFTVFESKSAKRTCAKSTPHNRVQPTKQPK